MGKIAHRSGKTQIGDNLRFASILSSNPFITSFWLGFIGFSINNLNEVAKGYDFHKIGQLIKAVTCSCE